MSEKVLKEAIEKAQREIDEMKAVTSEGVHRQKYHFMAQTGWINDPNGLIFYKGKYHFFYQYNPYGSFWDYMHWGHAVSDDMLSWEYLPVALAPSEDYDNHPKGGCFSGSAVVHDDKLWLIYTGTAYDGKGYVQTQNAAYSEDGITFKKYEGNPLIKAPEGVPGDLFRDPYVWKHGDSFYMVLGAGRNGMAQALLYRSENLTKWEFVNVLAQSRGEWGFMWECPSLFELDGKYVLSVSPMGAGERTCVYMVGDFSYETGIFVPQYTGEIDWGFHYYAPQPFRDEKGRTIMAAWANCWDWMPFFKDWGPTYKENWCGFYNIPRVVTLNEDMTLSMKPIEEIEAARHDGKAQENISVKDSLDIVKGYCYDAEMEIDLDRTDAESFTLILRRDGCFKTAVTYDLKAQEIRFDLTDSDGWSSGVARAPLYLGDSRKIDIRILSDRSSIELFNDEYRTNMSCNVYTVGEDEDNLLKVEKGQVYISSLRAYQLG